MKYSTLLLLLTVCLMAAYGQKWQGGSDQMPQWEEWGDDSQYQSHGELSSDDVLQEFVDSHGMSFSEFSNFTSDRYEDDQDPSLASGSSHHGSYYPQWVRRIHGWEDEIPDISGFTWLLLQLDLSEIQSAYLDYLSLWVEYEIEELREYHEIDDIRSEFFLEFVEDFYMPVSIYFIWEDRGWFESDLHDLIADAMSEVHDMFTSQQLSSARDLVEYMLQHHPEPHDRM